VGDGGALWPALSAHCPRNRASMCAMISTPRGVLKRVGPALAVGVARMALVRKGKTDYREVLLFCTSCGCAVRLCSNSRGLCLFCGSRTRLLAHPLEGSSIGMFHWRRRTMSMIDSALVCSDFQCYVVGRCLSKIDGMPLGHLRALLSRVECGRLGAVVGICLSGLDGMPLGN